MVACIRACVSRHRQPQRKETNVTYQIRQQGAGKYFVIDTKNDTVIKDGLYLDEANVISWQGKDPEKRYQILANSWARSNVLTWYSEENGIVITNGFPTLEEARLAIVEDLQEVCELNDYKYHPNPESDYSIIDTFTGEEVDYEISEKEGSHPDPDFIEPSE